MEEKTYSVTLADGTVMKDLKLNGNNFISANTINADNFTDNCAPVMISDGENEELHASMELIHVLEVKGEYWFALRDLTPEELNQIQVQSDIEYLAMMTGVEL